MKKIFIVLPSLFILLNTLGQSPIYSMPGENELHEGTWLQWPHHFTYGTKYRDRLDQTFIDMTSALVGSEKVFIIAYNKAEKIRIKELLNTAGVAFSNIVFYIFKTDDVWSRDNGPMYVYNESNELTILDWGFDGWGNDAPYYKDDRVPRIISNKTGVPKVNLSSMILEGGAVEIDGSGTFLATRSSIMGDGRNSSLSETQVNEYLSQYIGVTNIIWLDGLYGGMSDITDTHIDGFAKFLNDSTMVTMVEDDLDYWGLTAIDITTLMTAENADGVLYNKVFLPLTNKNVKTAWGANVGFKSSYVNYYVGNSVVLATTFNDANDDDALAIIETLYPDKTIVGIDSRNLLFYGGMVHCVTQQQPVILLAKAMAENENSNRDFGQITIFPNPASEVANISFYLPEDGKVTFEIYTIQGALIDVLQTEILTKGLQVIQVDTDRLPEGNYVCSMKADSFISKGCLLMVIK